MRRPARQALPYADANAVPAMISVGNIARQAGPRPTGRKRPWASAAASQPAITRAGEVRTEDQPHGSWGAPGGVRTAYDRRAA
ncbi:hypothetical protein [Streptomyces sp. SLBN-8D4]|uniref:hypothetical protein n=1 Tax=Streptomyces sp. SLBN-8D4 TaxID=3377728 RepID=UPI003C79D992